jgi:hypothetical protein
VQPGMNTPRRALNTANDGEKLVLADGIYTGSYGSVVCIAKSITIRALNVGQAVLDGENARRVIFIAAGTVHLHGLQITRGYAEGVSACFEYGAWTLHRGYPVAPELVKDAFGLTACSTPLLLQGAGFFVRYNAGGRRVTVTLSESNIYFNTATRAYALSVHADSPTPTEATTIFDVVDVFNSRLLLRVCCAHVFVNVWLSCSLTGCTSLCCARTGPYQHTYGCAACLWTI